MVLLQLALEVEVLQHLIDLCGITLYDDLLEGRDEGLVLVGVLVVLGVGLVPWVGVIDGVWLPADASIVWLAVVGALLGRWYTLKRVWLAKGRFGMNS
eukprot:8382196-Alexandrium_andersonii.AAC.1